ncbi:hypothetical protein D9757_010053 [Collybiopsis confluens]|uniref:Uncharacterized protein n=1 Tax=Collybiopsis confluens TaxID=2823264 RepID=A0A8H5LXV0_9AGAR|nr:hypothetical protein D9757_010053 [Collybiopsis confluens]
MDSDDNAVIAAFTDTIYFDIAGLIVTTVGYELPRFPPGVFIAGMIVATRSLLNKPWTRSRVALFACLVVISICFTWEIFYTGVLELMLTKYTLLEQGGSGLVAQFEEAIQKVLPLQYLPPWPGTINVLLSDYMVVWRAWVLFQSSKSLKFALAFLMFANIGVNVADCIWGDLEVKIETSGTSVLDWLSGIVSLAVNMFATGLISWMGWRHRRMKTNAAIHKRSRAENILLLLIESGAVYCAVQLIYSVFVLLQTYWYTSPSTALHIITSVGIISSAWYPVAVIILVNEGSSPVVETFHIHQSKTNGETDAQRVNLSRSRRIMAKDYQMIIDAEKY